MSKQLSNQAMVSIVTLVTLGGVGAFYLNSHLAEIGVSQAWLWIGLAVIVCGGLLITIAVTVWPLWRQVRHMNAVLSRAREGDVAGAIDEVQARLEVDPDSVHYWNLLGSLLAMNEDWAHASEAYAKAYEIDKNNRFACANLAASLWKAGQLKTALAQFAKAVEIAPDDPLVHANYALALCEAGEKREAAEMYEIACKLRGHSDYATPENREALESLFDDCRRELQQDDSVSR